MTDYSATTGGITNLAKSEAVLLGSWRSLKPDVRVQTVTAGGLGSSVVQYIPTGLLVAGSIPARGSPLFT